MSGDEQTDQEVEAQGGEATAEVGAGGKAQVKQQSMLSRPSDFVARPGFRNPPNQASKAQKKQGKRR